MRIEILQNNIVQWAEMQKSLFNQVMEGAISIEEYKSKNAKLSEDIDWFKKEIHELTK